MQISIVHADDLGARFERCVQFASRRELPRAKPCRTLRASSRKRRISSAVRIAAINKNGIGAMRRRFNHVIFADREILAKRGNPDGRTRCSRDRRDRPERSAASVNTESAAAPPASYSRAFQPVGNSALSSPLLGDAFFISAIIAGVCDRNAAAKSRRPLTAASARVSKFRARPFAPVRVRPFCARQSGRGCPGQRWSCGGEPTSYHAVSGLRRRWRLVPGVLRPSDAAGASPSPSGTPSRATG